MDIISSTQNKRVRFVKSLQTKPRFRRSERRLILEGGRLIASALLSAGRADFALYSPEHADYEVIAQLQARDCSLLPVSDAVLRHASDTQQAPGILAVFYLPRPAMPKAAQRVLILDEIREPAIWERFSVPRSRPASTWRFWRRAVSIPTTRKPSARGWARIFGCPYLNRAGRK